MPKKQKIKKTDIMKFKDKLTEKKYKIIERLIKDSNRYHEIFKNSTEGDLADIANDAYEKYLLYDLSLSEKEELINVEHALTKFEDGSYGECESCGIEIPLPHRVVFERKDDAVLWPPTTE